MHSESYNVSVVGSCISFFAGAFLFSGMNFLQLYNDIVFKNKIPEKNFIVKVSSIAFLGGGMTSFGLYFLSPNKVRNQWF